MRRARARIVVVDEGLIIEDGSHEELLAARGQYAALWDAFDHATSPLASRRPKHEPIAVVT